jgi:hypothetical protein
MARVSMVTRTIVTTEVEVLCMNVEKVVVEPTTFTVLGGILEESAMLKKLKTIHETDTFKLVHITKMKEIENLYGLTEEEFVKIAKPLDPDTRKVIESPITEEEQQEQTTEQTTEEQA